MESDRAKYISVSLFLAKILCCSGSFWKGHKTCPLPLMKEASVSWYLNEFAVQYYTCPTSSAVYESVLDQAEQLLPPLVFSCLQLALSLHSHSPALAMYQQVSVYASVM